MPKYLLIFEKTEAVRWLGHLDILRTFERAIRRAGLPIAFSGGFNPRERLSFAPALSTGVTGGAEPAILELTDALPTDLILADLRSALPPGIQVVTCKEIPDQGSRDLLNSFDRAIYTVVCKTPPDTRMADVALAVSTLLSQQQITISREREGRTKAVDIRPLLHSLTVLPESLADMRVTLEMTVSLGEGGTGKPAEVVTALATYLPGLTLRRAHRLRLLAREVSEENLPVFTDEQALVLT